MIRTRMAPSPTGEYHVGHIATLLKNYAFAKNQGGKFILRIEDTDQERKVEGAVEKILSVIRAYGLDWDEGPEKNGPYGPYVQSERLPIYVKHAQELVAAGMAYYCFCSRERLEEVKSRDIENKKPPMYDKTCRKLSKDEVARRLAEKAPHVIRLAVPEHEQITFTDLIRGEITVPSDTIDDQVLLKSDGFPTYHLAVVVDDHLMEITHIMRGEEWISSTPKHVLLYRAFGWKLPVFAHIPVFLNPDGKGKMSKRKGTVSAQSFLDAGYLPEALLNFFMILGWARKDEVEIMSLSEYCELFNPQNISPKSVVFDLKKLEWINGVYIRKLSVAELTQRIAPFLPEDFPREKLPALLPLVQERLVVLSDIGTLTEFFFRPVVQDLAALLKKGTPEIVTTELRETVAILADLPDSDWRAEKLEDCIRTLQERHDYKKNQYFMLLRSASTGKQATPPLFDTLEQIGKKVVLERLHDALNLVVAEQ